MTIEQNKRTMKEVTTKERKTKQEIKAEDEE
jgi:hypothetical protein